ncbi:carbohydrate ABC transporter permease [Vallitalea okinawensis]|uniref:carbohydrate ABC transporter permease n=1 Tax=Vallitalea okinawensis TaxID=2078660 RepID=UPI000CFD7544|nr:sugar ABC transporter permease [Vallitalea okinawensis]
MARKKLSPIRKNEIKWAYIFIAPLMIGLFVFYYFAFFQNFYYSFTKLGSFGAPEFIGLDNYIRLFQDEKFYQALKNTLTYVVIGVPSIVILSTGAAILINSQIKGRTFFRTALFLPAVTMPAAIGLLWRWLYNYEFGIINFILGKIGLDSIAWLSDPDIVIYAITIVLVWTMISTQMIIILAGLQGISKVYYEAAQIDGANKFQTLFRVTIPLLTPTLFFVTVMSIINVFQIFDFIFLMIQPTALSMKYAMSLVYYFYDRAFITFEKGYASAVSMMLFVIILVITLIQMKLQKKWVHYS